MTSEERQNVLANVKAKAEQIRGEHYPDWDDVKTLAECLAMLADVLKLRE